MTKLAIIMVAGLAAGWSVPASAAEVIARAGVNLFGPGISINEQSVDRSSTSAPPFRPAVSTTLDFGGASAFASADLATGTLRGRAVPGGSPFNTNFLAQMTESYTFSIASADPNKVTQLALDVFFEADVGPFSGVNLITRVTTNVGQASVGTGLTSNFGFVSTVNDASRSNVRTNLKTEFVNGLNRGVHRERLIFLVRGPTSTIHFDTKAEASSSGGGRVEFGNSAHFGFVLPDGASLSSDSGVAFVTMAAPAVPEPATWAMMIGGFGFIGVASRRRARSTISYA